MLTGGPGFVCGAHLLASPMLCCVYAHNFITCDFPSVWTRLSSSTVRAIPACRKMRILTSSDVVVVISSSDVLLPSVGHTHTHKDRTKTPMHSSSLSLFVRNTIIFWYALHRLAFCVATLRLNKSSCKILCNMSAGPQSDPVHTHGRTRLAQLWRVIYWM